MINFVLAINKTTNEIEAAEGFIQYSEELIDVAGVMWKTKANVKVPFLGVEVVKRLKKLTGCRVYLGVGANPITAVPLHKKMLKHNICKMNHFYKLMEKEHYNIAIINEKRIFVNKKNDKYDLVEITEIGEIKQSYFEEQKHRRPYKDSWYIDRRYFQHPIYQYKVWKITKIGEILAVIIAREIDMDGVKVLRIIDFLGSLEHLQEVSSQLDQIGQDYEYMDMYTNQEYSESFKAAGFVNKADDSNTIPDYFQPFVKKNIDIIGVSSINDVILYKGDGDQDRPNYR